MRHRERTPATSLQGRGGFTLIEMLVATGLVVLMLMLFATIFGDTVRIMREQQSIANNDQKARSVVEAIRSDLDKSTFRAPRAQGVYGIVPLHPNWPVDEERQRGYFYLSENDPTSGDDDVVQFTVDGRLTHRDPEIRVYQGKARGITPTTNPNEPDNDDGIAGNSVGQSHAAEVAYFLRGGNLYRRQLLLREPAVPTVTGSPSRFDAQPGYGPTGSQVVGSGLRTRLFSFDSGSGWTPSDYSAVSSNNFWTDFDYSAWNQWVDANDDGTPGPRGNTDQYVLMFNGIDSLNNQKGAMNLAIGIPEHRWGFRPPQPDGTLNKYLEGLPIEFLLQGTPVAPSLAEAAATRRASYIGRYTHQETSSPLFQWPGAVSQDGVTVPRNPMVDLSYGAGWDSNNDSVIDQYSGPRAGEDLILAGVESFDIEVWDDKGGQVTGALTPQWVNVGHTLGNGWFNRVSNKNPWYGPMPVNPGTDLATTLTTGINNCFDSWHPATNAGRDNHQLLSGPPSPLPKVGPPYQPLRIESSSGVIWGPNTVASLQARFFPGAFDAFNYDPMNPVTDRDDSYYYEVIAVSGTSMTGNKYPEWPREPGTIVQDGEVVWKCFDNRIGLQRMRITIRYTDPASGAPRQVSLVHSFVE